MAAILDQHTTSLHQLEEPPSPEAEASTPGELQPNGDDDSAQEEGEAEYVDPIDWDAALEWSAVDEGQPATEKEEEEEDSTAAEADVASTSPAQLLYPGEAARVAKIAALGLRFADAAADSGHEDAARAALGVLVRYAPSLPTPLLEELVGRMGQCRMTESTRNLAGAAAEARAGSSLQDPAVAALLAALVGGHASLHTAAVQGTLQAAGLAPHAAVYATVWGQPGQEAAVKQWQAQLAPEAAGARVAITAPVA